MQQTLSKDQILQEVEGWVKDPVYTRSMSTIFFKLEKTYSLVKTLIVQALGNIRRELSDVLHTIKMFEGKIESICK